MIRQFLTYPNHSKK